MSGANVDVLALKRTVSNLGILDGPMFSSSCGTSSAILFDLLKPEDEDTMILRMFVTTYQ
jgi:hypothetical protein